MTGTQRQICETLVDLMEDKPFDKIKVTELAAHAGVSRSTFYTYFDSIYDVLQAIEDEFLANIIDEKDIGLDNDMDVLAKNFVFVRDNLRTLQVLLGPNGEPSFSARFANRSRRVLSSIADDVRSPLTTTQLDIVNEFSKAGKLQVFRWWAVHKNDVSVNEIIDMMDRLSAAMHDIVRGK